MTPDQHTGSPEHMKHALQLATENVASGRGGPFGCGIVKDGRVVAEGVNLVTSSGDPTAHAEIVAIRAACAALGSFQLTGCDVYASCEPCPMCMGALYWARPSRVFFAADHSDASAAGFDDSMIREQLTRPPEAWSIPTGRMMKQEGQEPFQAWIQSGKKVPY